MPTIYKALIVVFGLSAIVLAFFRPAFSKAIGTARFHSWALMWLAITFCVFVIGNFWIYCGVVFVLIFFLSRMEPVAPAVFALLVAATPPYPFEIPGFAGIYKLFTIFPHTPILFAVLLPAMFFSKHMKKIASAGRSTDLFVLLWILLLMALSFNEAPSLTHGMRLMVEQFLGIAPIYYVFSRFPQTIDDQRVITAAFVLPILILSAVAIMEFGMWWHFYNHIADAWNAAVDHGYKMRGGFLRSSASAHNPIPWAFLAMCGIGLGLAVFNDGMSRLYRWTGFGLITGGLIVSLSRGPWIGAAAMALIFVLSSPKAFSRAIQLSLGGAMAFIIALFTPAGQKIIDLLPFIGSSDADTIDYREQLLQVSWEVIKERPLFGIPTYEEHPTLEVMRQGEGIIDIVNTYLAVTLGSGFVGLALFIAVFASAILVIRKAMKSAQQHNEQLALYCRAYFATLVGVAMTIFTTSSINPIPLVYWGLIGGAVALARIEEVERKKAALGAPEENASPTEPQADARPAFDWK